MEKPSTARIALKWGIISAIISIVFTIVLYTFDLWKMVWIAAAFGVAVTVVILVLAAKEFKSLNNGFMTFGEGLGMSMLIIVVSGLISNAFNQLYVNVIDTSIKGKITDMQEEMYVKQGLSEEQISMAMEQLERFNNPSMQFLFSMLGTLFFGFLLSLIISAIMKKDRPVFE
ncbi:MAG: DUF4199 domain-containing protein [Spirosomaceae bacterium]|nr:DUF4199 domain-containing protein [Spirosomataceae bacterium]